MIADRFELAGWTVHLLGANLPAEEMTLAVGALHADAVILSASTHYHRTALRSYVDVLRAAHPNLRVWVGGSAFAIEHDGWSADEMLDIAAIPSLAAAMG
jgi:methanogenic corrinoid protein MtbC1